MTDCFNVGIAPCVDKESFEPAVDLQVDDSSREHLRTQQVWCGNLLKCDCKAQKVPDVLHYDMEGVHNRNDD